MPLENALISKLPQSKLDYMRSETDGLQHVEVYLLQALRDGLDGQ